MKNTIKKLVFIITTVFFAILGLLVYMGLYLKMFRIIVKDK